MKPTWEKAWDHRHIRLKSYYAYENWIWRIQKSLQTALSKRYYSPASEQAELESRRVRRKIQNDPWGTNVWKPSNKTPTTPVHYCHKLNHNDTSLWDAVVMDILYQSTWYACREAKLRWKNAANANGALASAGIFSNWRGGDMLEELWHATAASPGQVCQQLLQHDYKWNSTSECFAMGEDCIRPSYNKAKQY